MSIFFFSRNFVGPCVIVSLHSAAKSLDVLRDAMIQYHHTYAHFRRSTASLAKEKDCKNINKLRQTNFCECSSANASSASSNTLADLFVIIHVFNHTLYLVVFHVLNYKFCLVCLCLVPFVTIPRVWLSNCVRIYLHLSISTLFYLT